MLSGCCMHRGSEVTYHIWVSRRGWGTARCGVARVTRRNQPLTRSYLMSCHYQQKTRNDINITLYTLTRCSLTCYRRDDPALRASSIKRTMHPWTSTLTWYAVNAAEPLSLGLRSRGMRAASTAPGDTTTRQIVLSA